MTRQILPGSFDHLKSSLMKDWKVKLAFEAGPIVHHLDTGPMGAGHSGDKAEAEPIA
jgi:hypothetical protein